MAAVAATRLFLECQERFKTIYTYVGADQYMPARFDAPPPTTVPPYMTCKVALGEFMYHSCGYTNKMKIVCEARMPEGWEPRNEFELCLLRMLKEGREVSGATDFRGAPTPNMNLDPTGTFKAAKIEIMPWAFEMWLAVDY